MRCEEFESLLIEAARVQLSDATARQDAIRHQETCAHCAERASDEERLTAALNDFATSTAALQAPTRVESALLEAFCRRGAMPVGIDATKHDGTFESHRAKRWSRRASVASALAASLILIMAATLRFKENHATLNATSSTQASRPVTPQEIKNRPEASINVKQVIDERLEIPKQSTVREQILIAHQHRSSAGASASKHGTDRQGSMSRIHDGGLLADVVQVTAKADETESATDFLPLVAGSSVSAPLESGQLVRVSLPRTALASLGLPWNVERSGSEQIKADVLLGADGTAHAIRFIH